MDLSFLDQEPPPNYVPGVGRGATGFSTSADTRNFENEPYTNFTDNDAKQDQEDIEADKIYEQIQLRRTLKDLTETSPSNSLRNQFSDLKRSLTTISLEEWENLPEAGDMTRRNKRQRLIEQQSRRTYAAPDSLIASTSSSVTDFDSISKSRNELLNKQLDGLMKPKTEEFTEIDLDTGSAVEVADIERSRLILNSLLKAEPKKASSWIASARLELQAKDLKKAKNLINQGCKIVPGNENIWLENLKIHQYKLEDVKLLKNIISQGLRFNPKSELLWLKAFELETDVSLKRNLLMQGLESLPSNIKLWEHLIELQDDSSNAEKLLQKALELCPTHWPFTLSLIGLSNHKDSKDLLNKARKLMPDNFDVWITAAKLEERENDKITDEKLIKIIDKGLSSVMIDQDRKTLLDYAVKCEAEGYSHTCKAVLWQVFNKDADQISPSTLLLEVKNYPQSISQYMYDIIISKFPNSIDVWAQVFESLKLTKDFTKLYEFYQKAIDANSNEVMYSLMYAKDKWILDNDIPAAREILLQSMNLNSTSEELWIARVKLEIKTGNNIEALKISQQSILQCDQSPRIWYKHIHVMECISTVDPKLSSSTQALSALEIALDKFPECEKLYLQKAQHLIRNKEFSKAREAAAIGTRSCPDSALLWRVLAEIDDKYLKSIIKARSVLDNAVIKVPQSDVIWEAKIKLERRNENLKAARLAITKALQLFPTSPRIWTQNLELLPKTQRQKALVEALKKTDNSTSILLNIGILFWLDGKISKAKPWFDRSLSSDKSNGDCWAWSYTYSKTHSTEEETTKLVHEFTKKYEQIHTGDTWNSINKDVYNFQKEPLQILELVSQKLLKS